jgi:hypothetical protein
MLRDVPVEREPRRTGCLPRPVGCAPDSGGWSRIRGAIDVVASGGTVTLKGPVFEAEVDQLMKGVAAVAGVTTVENSLEPHRDAAHVSALQGQGHGRFRLRLQRGFAGLRRRA